MHEEDYGILWKHLDLHGGTDEVRRSRRLVVSSIATVGNYEYGFYWYFYLDGTIQLEVKLTGIVSPMAVTPGDAAASSPTSIAPGLAAPHHQHLFSARLDLDVDGAANTVYEVEAEAVPAGPDNPWGNAFVPHVDAARRPSSRRSATIERGRAAARGRSSTRERTTGSASRSATSSCPAMSTPTLLASPESSVGQRAGFARTTSGSRRTRATSGAPPASIPNQHARRRRPAARGPRPTGRSTDTDVVLWYTFGVTHIVRPEDWPVMPVEYTGFLLMPVGFFDRNPALDVPPTSSRRQLPRRRLTPRSLEHPSVVRRMRGCTRRLRGGSEAAPVYGSRRGRHDGTDRAGRSRVRPR